MMRRGILIATASIFGLVPAMADSPQVVPPATASTIQCIHRVLKSSDAVQSVDFYYVDEARFAIEYSFRDKDRRIVVMDIELFLDPDGTVLETDKVPRAVPEEVSNAGIDLQLALDLYQKCQFRTSFDNLIPEPNARSEWQKMEWPKR